MLPRTRSLLSTSLLRGAGLAAALLLPVSRTSGQTVRLNRPFEFESVVGKVRDFEVRPAEDFLFFRADDRRAGVLELFVASTRGATAVRRENRPLPPERSVVDFQPSPASDWIVFLADRDEDEVFELYSRRPSDSAPRKLNAPLPRGGDVVAFAPTPDGTRVVYIADQEVGDRFELYSVPIDGSAAPVKRSGPLVPGGDVRDFALNPTGTHAVYRADQDSSGQIELYGVSLELGTVSKLNTPVPFPGAVPTAPVAFTPDGATVVFKVTDASQVTGLFRAPVDGSSPAVRLDTAATSTESVLDFELSPDGRWVVYRALFGTRLFTAPLDGSTPPIQVVPPGPASSSVLDFAISPSSTRLVCSIRYGLGSDAMARSLILAVGTDGSGPSTLDENTAGLEYAGFRIGSDGERLVYLVGDTATGLPFTASELRSVRLDGTGRVRLDDPGGTPTDMNLGDPPVFTLSSDATRVLYLWHPLGTNESEGHRGLYSVPSDGSAPPRTLVSSGASFQFGATRSRDLFLAELGGSGTTELYSQAANGTDLVRLNGPLARGTFADVGTFQLDGNTVVHTADARTNHAFDVYAGPVDGDTHARRLSTSPVRAGAKVHLSHAAGRVITTRSGVVESTPLDGSAGPVQLTDDLGGASGNERIQLSADGMRVVFQTQTNPRLYLFSIPIAGGVPTPLTDFTVNHFRVAPSGGRVVFAVDGSPGRLFSVPVDGSAAPILLEPALDGPLDRTYVVSPDGTHVVYRSGELYSAPVDGSAGRTLLSSSLTGSDLHVTPDGRWVVFRDQNGVFGVPIDGSLPARRLDTSNTGTVQLVVLGPDSTRVAFVRGVAPSGLELFSAPVDGSAPAVRLSDPAGASVLLPPGREAAYVQIAPDSSRVVYVTGPENGTNFGSPQKLFSVPLGGGELPTKLTAPLAPFRGIPLDHPTPFAISPDSRQVVYVADRENEALYDLHWVPIDGSEEPLQLTSALARPGVLSLAITDDSRRAVYTATERAEVTELFSCVLTRDPWRSHLAPDRR